NPDSTQAVPQTTLRSLDPLDCDVLLIRHGRSADVVPGSPESADPPLHTVGVEQARRLADRLTGRPLHAVYSSHLARARQTAQPLADDRGYEVQVFPDLEEVRLGDWSNGEFRRLAAEADPEWVAWSRTGRWDGIPGAETDDEFRGRVAGVVDALALQHRGQSIAIVAHGGSIGAYMANLFGIHRSLWLSVENTSITQVRIGPHGSMVITANDCHHLYDPLRSGL
ncbi:MAG: histidine phosphatase family protein, partial [Actinomycetota bacterium]